MTSYTIQESPLGTYALMLGTQLIMQATERADCERVKTGLEHRGHDKTNLVPADTKENR